MRVNFLHFVVHILAHVYVGDRTSTKVSERLHVGIQKIVLERLLVFTMLTTLVVTTTVFKGYRPLYSPHPEFNVTVQVG